MQIDSVSTSVGRKVAEALSGPELTKEVDRVTGSWIRGLTLDYRLLPLFQKTVFLTRLQGSGIRFDLGLAGEDAQDSEEPPAEGDIVPPSWSVRGGTIHLSDGRVRIWEPASGEPPSPSPWTLSGLAAAGGDLRLGPGFEVTVDSLQGRFRPSGRADPWGHIRVAGRWGGGQLALDTLLFQSPESRVAGGGRFPLNFRNPSPDALDSMELKLEAAPGPLVRIPGPSPLRRRGPIPAAATDCRSFFASPTSSTESSRARPDRSPSTGTT